MRTALAFCAIGIASPGPAQTVATIPTGLATKEGSSMIIAPLVYTPSRILSGYSQKATGWKSAKIIRSLTARRDAFASLKTGFKADMQVWLSSKGISVSCASPYGDRNHGTDKRLFMKKKSFSFASFPKATKIPSPFDIQLKGDAPFVAYYQVLVDWRVYTASQMHGLFFVDAHRPPTTGTYGSRRLYGKSCNPTNFMIFVLGHNVGEDLRIFGWGPSAGDIALCWVSTKRVAVSVGNGCWINADPFAAGAVIHPSAYVTTRPDGYITFGWGKVSGALKNKMLWSQCIAFGKGNVVRWSGGSEFVIGDYAPTIPMGNRYEYATPTTPFKPDKDLLLQGSADAALVFKVD